MKYKIEFMNNIKLEFEGVINLNEDSVFRDFDSWDTLTKKKVSKGFILLLAGFGVGLSISGIIIKF